MPIEGVYPLSTQDGKAVPLEIVKPSAFVYWELAKATEKNIVIAAGYSVCVAYATCNCILRNENTTFGAIAPATEYSHAIMIPAGAMITLSLAAGAGKIYPLADGVLYLSAAAQWAILAQDMQTRVG